MVTVQLDPDHEQRLRELASSQGQEVSDLARRVLEAYVHRSSLQNGVPNLSAMEAQLLAEINHGVPEDTWNRYHELMDRRRDETLTRDEHEELKSLTDQVEIAHARRLEKLAKLAELRSVPLDDLMDELGFRDPGYV